MKTGTRGFGAADGVGSGIGVQPRMGLDEKAGSSVNNASVSVVSNIDSMLEVAFERLTLAVRFLNRLHRRAMLLGEGTAGEEIKEKIY